MGVCVGLQCQVGDPKGVQSFGHLVHQHQRVFKSQFIIEDVGALGGSQHVSAVVFEQPLKKMGQNRMSILFWSSGCLPSFGMPC